MGIWAAIKKLNSTVGTENFAPLDKIFLKQKKLVASDSDYILVTTGDTTEITQKITMINPGSVRVVAHMRRASYDTSTKITVYVNDVKRAELISGYSDNNYNVQSQDISFNAGDVITFGVNSRYYRDLKLCASVTDSTLYEMEG